jgi:hypothetical protein
VGEVAGEVVAEAEEVEVVLALEEEAVVVVVELVAEVLVWVPESECVC